MPDLKLSDIASLQFFDTIKAAQHLLEKINDMAPDADCEIKQSQGVIYIDIAITPSLYMNITLIVSL